MPSPALRHQHRDNLLENRGDRVTNVVVRAMAKGEERFIAGTKCG